MSIRGGITVFLVGPPGTSKSTMLASATEVEGIEKALLLAPTPREINSWKYRQNGITETAEVFQDFGWHPAIGSYEAGAFSQLYRRLVSLYEDETYDAVLLDTYN